jgi:hypothetical protein
MLKHLSALNFGFAAGMTQNEKSPAYQALSGAGAPAAKSLISNETFLVSDAIFFLHPAFEYAIKAYRKKPDRKGKHHG